MVSVGSMVGIAVGIGVGVRVGTGVLVGSGVGVRVGVGVATMIVGTGVEVGLTTVPHDPSHSDTSSNQARAEVVVVAACRSSLPAV